MTIQTNKSVIVGPRITEKAANAADKNAYVFNVTPDANKTEIKKEIKRIYNVTAVQVNIVNTGGKTVFSRGRVGRKNDFKKAYVYLKKGDTISVM